MSPRPDARSGAEPHGTAGDHIRLLTKVARMYHERGMRQPQIAEHLHISQPRVSRLLKQAVDAGIVRTVVITPRGVHAELEDAVEAKYGLAEVVVADSDGYTDERAVTQAIAAAGAIYLETTLTRDDRIGISSWSATLLATVDSMHPAPTLAAGQVVQILGGAGTSAAQIQASRLTGGLARHTRAEAVYLVAPGLVADRHMHDALQREPSISSVINAWKDLTVALVGVGSLEPSSLLRESGNAIAATEEQQLQKQGAIGDVCMRFFDADGRHIDSGLDDRVLGISAEMLRTVPRRVGVAGGQRKWKAIRAALLGGWVNVLITDYATAVELTRS